MAENQNIVDEERFSKKKVWNVPAKCVLVCKNILFKTKYTKENDLRINLPFVRAKLVEIASRTIGIDANDKVTNKCLDGFEISVNPAITIRVVDAEKYLFKSSNPEAGLTVKLEQVLKNLIATKNSDELIGLEINLDNPKFAIIKAQFNDIESKSD